MNRLDHAMLERQRRRNRLVSVAVVAGIMAWAAMVGWLVLGEAGVVWAALAGAVLLLLQPVRSVAMLKALYGAIPLAPSDAPGLYGMMGELARRAGLSRVPPILYIPRREVVALSSGWGDDAAIAVSEGLLRRLPPRELVAVLGHETAHLRAGDLKILRLAEAAGRMTRLLSLMGLLLIAILLPASVHMGADLPLLAIALLFAAPVASDLLLLKLSRTREFEADAASAALTEDPQGLALALRRIESMQPGGWERLRRPIPFLSWLRTHPDTGERLARLHELAPAPEPRWITLAEALMAPGWQRVAVPPRGWWLR